MSPTSNLSSLLAAIFLLLTSGEIEANECCKYKRVGSISYTLDQGLHSHPELPDKCLNNCVYTVAGSSSPKFCFQKGDLPTECLSDKPGTETGSGSGSGPTNGPVSKSNCTTISGPAEGSVCIFPFNYNGVSYFGCTTIEGDPIPWCSTQTDDNDNHVGGVGAWGYCDATCPIQEASAALACTAGTKLGKNLDTAFGTCFGNNSISTMRKVMKKMQLSRNDEQCYSFGEIMEWVKEEYVDDVCVLQTIGWMNENFDFNQDAIMSDVTSLDSVVTVPLFEGHEECVTEIMYYVVDHKCVSTFTEEEQGSLRDTAEKIATYECFLHLFEQGCMEFLKPAGKK